MSITAYETALTVSASEDAVRCADYVGHREDGSLAVAFASRMSGRIWSLSCFESEGTRRLKPGAVVETVDADESELDTCAAKLGLKPRRHGHRGIRCSDIGTSAEHVAEVLGETSESVDALTSRLDELDWLTERSYGNFFDDASAYTVLHRVLAARAALGAIDDVLAGLQDELSAGIGYANTSLYREERRRRREADADAWLVRVTTDMGERVGTPFRGHTVGECEDFIDAFRKRAGSPYTVGASRKQWGYVTAICDTLGMRRPRIGSSAEASAFIRQYEDAYKKAYAEKKANEGEDK